MAATITVKAFVEPDARCHHLTESFVEGLRKRSVTIEDRCEVDGWTVLRICGNEAESLVAIVGEVAGALHPHLELAIERT